VEETTSPYPPPEARGEPAFLTGIAYGVLAVLGAVLGVIGSFEFSWQLGAFPVAALAWTAVNVAAFRGAGWAMEGKLGVAAPAVPWLVVVLVLSSSRPEGDLVVTGTTAGYVFIFGGAIAAAVALASTPSPRSWLLGGTVPTPDVRR
jgi:hypothetical protein